MLYVLHQKKTYISVIYIYKYTHIVCMKTIKIENFKCKNDQ